MDVVCSDIGSFTAFFSIFFLILVDVIASTSLLSYAEALRLLAGLFADVDSLDFGSSTGSFSVFFLILRGATLFANFACLLAILLRDLSCFRIFFVNFSRFQILCVVEVLVLLARLSSRLL